MLDAWNVGQHGRMLLEAQEKQQTIRAAVEVCDEGAPFGRRADASTKLIDDWNPYPFDPPAQRALRFIRPGQRAELRDQLILALLDAAAESARALKRRRIGPRWIKDETGVPAKLSVLDLDIDDLVRVLRTLAIKEYEKLLLGLLPLVNSSEINQPDIMSMETEVVDEPAEPYPERLSQVLHMLSPRERELMENLKSDPSRAEAARQMGITASTVRVHWFNIKKKLRSLM